MPTEVNILDFTDYVVLYLNAAGRKADKGTIFRLLYYVQAWHLVYFDKHPLYNEVPHAECNGPLHPSLSKKYEDEYYCDNPINPEIPAGMNIAEATQAKLASLQLQEDQSKLIHTVLRRYCELEHGMLLILPLYEGPWLKARAGLGVIERGNRTVTFKSTYAFFNGRLIRRKKREEKERKIAESKNNSIIKTQSHG